jgi:hypothetical protein
MDDSDPMIAAERHSLDNKEELLAGDQCGCYFCVRVFNPSEITEWLVNQETQAQTAFCPHCGIDALLGVRSGYPLTRDFLAAMRSHWFQMGVEVEIPSISEGRP